MSVYNGERYFPYSVALEITLACNMKCIHCGSSASSKEREHSLKLDEWIRVINELSSLKAEYVTLSGGEPFMYSCWRELIEYISLHNAHRMKMSAITNGSLLEEEDIIFLKSKNMALLAISLDGDRPVHDFIRQTPGSFQKVMQAIKWCKKHGLRVGLVTSFNKYNFDIRESILKIILDSGADIWQVQVVNAFGRAGKKKAAMLIDREQYINLIDDVYQWKGKYGQQLIICPADSLGYCHPKTAALFDGATWDGCSAGKYNLGIESNGNVKGCLSLQSDDFIAGNIRERSLIDIWFDDEAFHYTRKYDSSLMQGACRECRSAPACRAGCLGMAYSINNTLYENPYCYQSIIGLHKGDST